MSFSMNTAPFVLASQLAHNSSIRSRFLPPLINDPNNVPLINTSDGWDVAGFLSLPPLATVQHIIWSIVTSWRGRQPLIPRAQWTVLTGNQQRASKYFRSLIRRRRSASVCDRNLINHPPPHGHGSCNKQPTNGVAGNKSPSSFDYVSIIWQFYWRHFNGVHNKSTEKKLGQMIGSKRARPKSSRSGWAVLWSFVQRWMWMRVSSCEPFNQWANNSLSGLCSWCPHIRRHHASSEEAMGVVSETVPLEYERKT